VTGDERETTALICIPDACSSGATQPLLRGGWWLKEYQAFEHCLGAGREGN